MVCFYSDFSHFGLKYEDEVLCDILSDRASKLLQLEDFDFSFYLIKTSFFGKSEIRLMANLMLFEAECRTVSHLKSLTRGMEHRTRLGGGSAFSSATLSSKVRFYFMKWPNDGFM